VQRFFCCRCDLINLVSKIKTKTKKCVHRGAAARERIVWGWGELTPFSTNLHLYTHKKKIVQQLQSSNLSLLF
jgi:hypothetical protein